MSNLRILHAIHDFLPRHRAGSEIYAFELCRVLAKRHHITVVAAEYDLARDHGHVEWRLHDGVPVIEIVNNWICGSFEDTYRPPVVTEQLQHVLSAVQPDVLHIHNLLNLSFDLPALARKRGIPIVATLHDYTMVCPSGGQRIHAADEHLCETIDPVRCARCFRESPFYAQATAGRVASALGGGLVARAAGIVRRRLPMAARSLASGAGRAAGIRVGEVGIAARLARAQQLFDEIDLFVAPSQSIADEYQRLGVHESKLRVSDYGFVPFPPSTRNGYRGPLRIGFAGTLVWHKGAHILVDAVGKLPQHAIDVRIFGDVNVFPDYVAKLRQRARGLPVHFMGAFDKSSAPAVYAGIDVLVVPSIWLENSPLVIHEAFMAGVPVVGARIGGIAGLVDDGVNGLLYDPRSGEALAAALRSVVDDRGRLDALRQNLPAVKSIDTDACEWEALYRELVRAKSTSGEAVPS